MYSLHDHELLGIETMHDERYYEQVTEELRLLGPKPGLWAKSFAEARGDDAKAKALYLRYRAEQIERLDREIKEKADSKSESITIYFILIGLPMLILSLILIRVF